MWCLLVETEQRPGFCGLWPTGYSPLYARCSFVQSVSLMCTHSAELQCTRMSGGIATMHRTVKRQVICPIRMVATTVSRQVGPISGYIYLSLSPDEGGHPAWQRGPDIPRDIYMQLSFICILLNMSYHCHNYLLSKHIYMGDVVHRPSQGLEVYWGGGWPIHQGRHWAGAR